MTITAPRHLHVNHDGDHGHDEEARDKPTQTGPVATAVFGFAVLAFVIFILTLEGKKVLDTQPAVIMSLMTVFGVCIINSGTVWCSRWILFRAKQQHAEIVGLRAEVAALRKEQAEYRAERMVMIADARKEMTGFVDEIKGLRAEIADLRKVLDEAVDAGLVSSVHGVLNGGPGPQRATVRTLPNR